jgi:hypothetical protein
MVKSKKMLQALKMDAPHLNDKKTDLHIKLTCVNSYYKLVYKNSY